MSVPAARRPFAASFLLLSILLPAAARAQGAAPKLPPTEIAAKSRTALVTIFALDAAGQPMSQGSGFFVNGSGLLITNLHVIDGGSKLQVKLHTDEIYDTVFLRHADERRDIAILKIPAANTPSLKFGDDTILQIGERVFAMGNPLGMEGTFSDGLVSARRMLDGTQMIQMTAPISPGSSGGPVLDERGLVIGVSTAKREGGENLNLAVPTHYILPMLEIPGERAFSASSLANLLGRPEPSAAVPSTAAAGGGAGAAARWHAGDRVTVRSDAKAICQAHPVGWADDMGALLGQVAEVVEFDASDNTYRLRTPGSDSLWWFPAAALASASGATAGAPAGDGSGGAEAYIAAVRVQLEAVSAAARSAGFGQIGEDAIGGLQQGEKASVTVTLERGAGYLFGAVCDQDCRDLDLVLVDPSGDVVATDAADDDHPVVNVERAAAGTYQLIVSMANCSQGPCAYGVRAFQAGR